MMAYTQLVSIFFFIIQTQNVRQLGEIASHSAQTNEQVPKMLTSPRAASGYRKYPAGWRIPEAGGIIRQHQHLNRRRCVCARARARIQRNATEETYIGGCDASPCTWSWCTGPALQCVGAAEEETVGFLFVCCALRVCVSVYTRVWARASCWLRYFVTGNKWVLRVEAPLRRGSYQVLRGERGERGAEEGRAPHLDEIRVWQSKKWKNVS